MRIAVFYHLPFGGAKRVVRDHVKGLTSLGHTVDVYTYVHEQDIFEPGEFADNEYKYEFRQKNINLPFVKRVAQDVTTFYYLKQLHKKIAKDIDARGYDIVLAHIDVFTQAPFLLSFLQTKSVYFCLEPLRMVYEYSLKISDELPFINKLYEQNNRAIRKKIDRDNARHATHTLAISYFGREYMIHAFNLYPKISYLGVDESLFKPQKIKKKRQVLFVAEREYIYGYDLAEAAMQLIPAEKRPELKIMFGTKKSQRISDKDFVKTYNESVVTLSLSRFDTFGLIPLESMACEVPVIALNVAGYRETVLDGKTGFLTEFDPKEIAEKIMMFFDNPQLAEKMGKEGRKWVEQKWTWSNQIKILENLLHGFVSEKEKS